MENNNNNPVFSNSTLGLEMSLNHHQTTTFHHQQPPFDQESPPPPPHISNLNNPATTDDSGDGKVRGGGSHSPWHRMKWTDNMVRLLIMVVFYIGDEGGGDGQQQPEKKKSGGGGGGGGTVVQKKGKWKSVSMAMMERGFYVSPQQCEDKFNDLNKRYKRVNDILGKGTACKVVENHGLLETMDHIPGKLKEEVKKLLNSKHLFFREMCAYHNSCGGGAGGNAASRHSLPPEVNTTEHTSREICVHSNDNEDIEDDEDGDDDDENEDVDDRYHPDEEEDDGLSSRKRVRTAENDVHDNMIHHFNDEVSSIIQDLTKGVGEKRQWMRLKMLQLEEQRLGFEVQSYELEKQRLKWMKFSYSKEREMEMEKLKNERMKVENERMVLLLRKKEMELVVDLQQQYPSSING